MLGGRRENHSPLEENPLTGGPHQSRLIVYERAGGGEHWQQHVETTAAPMQMAPGLKRSPLDLHYLVPETVSGWESSVFRYPGIARPQGAETFLNNNTVTVSTNNTFTTIASFTVPIGYEACLQQYFIFDIAADFVTTGTYQFRYNSRQMASYISTITGASVERTSIRKEMIIFLESGSQLILGATTTAQPRTIASEIYGWIAPIQGAGAKGSGKIR